MEFTPLQIVVGLAFMALIAYTLILVVNHGHDGFDDQDQNYI